MLSTVLLVNFMQGHFAYQMIYQTLAVHTAKDTVDCRFTQNASQVKFNEDQKICLLEYIAYFDKRLDAWNLQDTVAAFNNAFAW